MSTLAILLLVVFDGLRYWFARPRRRGTRFREIEPVPATLDLENIPLMPGGSRAYAATYLRAACH